MDAQNVRLDILAHFCQTTLNHGGTWCNLGFLQKKQQALNQQQWNFRTEQWPDRHGMYHRLNMFHR